MSQNLKGNNSIKVLLLISTFVISYFLLSLFSTTICLYYPSFKNVNIISNIIEKPKNKIKTRKKPKEIVNFAINTFDSYSKKNTLIAFDKDTTEPALINFNQKLIALSQNKKVKIRIAWFGDSQIEGDLLTQDVRKLFQDYFNKMQGVGFVPINSVSSEFRNTAKIQTLGAFRTDNFKNNESNSSLFLSGYSYTSDNLSIYFKDNVKRNSNQTIEKWLLFGKGDSIVLKFKDSSIKKIAANNEFNRTMIDNSNSNSIQFNISSGKTPIYGISSEPESGIMIDNFSFRGISGVELKKIKKTLLSDLNSDKYYDLVIIQYGVNLMFRPDDTNYDYYYRAMNPIVRNIKKIMPNTDFLLISCSDRAFRYDDEWKTAKGIDSLINIQAKLSNSNNIAFYNLYKSIGGAGTIVKWADSIHLANKDYIHFNYKGSKIVARKIFGALINDYKKALKKNNESTKKSIQL